MIDRFKSERGEGLAKFLAYGAVGSILWIALCWTFDYIQWEKARRQGLLPKEESQVLYEPVATGEPTGYTLVY